MPQRRDDIKFCIHNDWFTSQWARLLPKQSLPLAMLFSTAAQNGLPGSSAVLRRSRRR